VVKIRSAPTNKPADEAFANVLLVQIAWAVTQTQP